MFTREHRLGLALNHDSLSTEKLRQFLQSDFQPLRLAAVRTLALQSGPEQSDLLAELAGDANESALLRAEAIAGLAAVPDKLPLLESLADGEQTELAEEAARMLRLAGARSAPAEDKPAPDDLAAWEKLLSSGGDAEAGRRIFMSSVGPRCANCHQYGGRGGMIGPDLTRLSRSNSRERIIASILQPSREIAPRYQPWVLVTTDGKTHAALRLPRPGDSGEEFYADSNGNQFTLQSEDIEFREASDISIMPAGLEKTLSIQDLRDLVAFLSSSTTEPRPSGSAP